MSCLVAPPGKESDGLTRLDVAKHLVRVLAASLPAGIELGVVAFDDMAELAVRPTEDLATVMTTIDPLCPRGGTRLWEGLTMALDQRPTDILVLTDGETDEPPRGIPAMLASAVGNSGVTISTIGISYECNAGLLETIARNHGGLFGFVPDGSMIGTVFINWLAAYTTRQLSGAPTTTLVDEDLRLRLIEQLRRLLHGGSVEPDLFLEPARASSSVFGANALEDWHHPDPSKGQILKALGPDAFLRWGRRYLLALTLAHERRHCMNFKDATLQLYKNSGFAAEQARIEAVFLGLPPPTPSRAAEARRAPSMGVYLSSDSGCFAPSTLVELEGGEMVPIGTLRRGSILAGGDTVIAVVRSDRPARVRRPFAGASLGLTDWHPVRISGGKWFFPAEHDRWEVDEEEVPYVVNLVLSSGSFVAADGYEAVTLGHGLTGPVVEHAYFGTAAVVEDILNELVRAKFPMEPLITIGVERDVRTGLVRRMLFKPTESSDCVCVAMSVAAVAATVAVAAAGIASWPIERPMLLS